MDPHPDLTSGVIRGIGWLYLILCAMNVFWTARAIKLHLSIGQVAAWAVYSAMLAMIGFAHVTGGAEPNHFLIRMPLFFKTIVDAGAKPEVYFTLSIALFAAVVWLREQLVKPTVAWLILNGMILFLTLSMSDYDFRQIVGKPDNVPIVSMLFIVAFFTWLYFKRAVDNDQRIAAGRPLFEQEDNDKVLVWPDLVYTEMICMVIVTAVLVVWGIVLQAPLEEPASSVRTPNPSKAPWYFLGLQEMLVYYDPWMAGVVLPSMILVGLMALPYIDFNKKGNGYYTFNQRKFSILTFMFGFLPLWIGLIILGTFLRGPNWNFFGIYELWDVHKLVVLNNVNLSEYFWGWLGQPLPVAPAGSGPGWQMLMILYREWLGLVLVAAYLFVLPMVMAMTIFRSFFMRMGFIRYMVFANLVLFMACLPIKMILRWTINLKYIVAIPEWFFNIQRPEHDMPATEDNFRSLRTMHVVSAASAFALLAATLWMMKADYTDEWRGIQSTAYKLQAQQIDEDLTSLTDEEFKQKETELQDRVDKAEEVVKENKDEVAKAQKEVDHLDGQFQVLSRNVKFERAEKDKVRADLDLEVRDGKTGKALKPALDKFEEVEARVNKLELELQELQAKFDAAKEHLALLTRPRDEAVAALKKHETELGRLKKAKDKIDPPFFSAAGFKHALMEVPIVEGFNGPLKPAQIWLPDLTINYGGAKDVARFDRCTTCHVNIDRVGTGNVPAFPLDPHGISMDNADDYLHAKPQTSIDGTVVTKKKSRLKSDGSKVGYANPFATHPNPDLFLTSASPHPMQKFGCTSCHEGQGSGTSFQNASHAPVSPDVGENWHKKYGYAANHFWEYPMYPRRLGEAACLKCHHNVVELGVNPKFGESAPKLFKGYELIRQYGCFGCHEINGFATGKPIGPDMRLEPQTPEEAKRIAADPAAVAGTMRKVGPGLRHLASKTNKAWTENWVEEPKRFRPETRMPQFFNLTNQKDPHAKLLQPVEIAGIAEYLFNKSEKASLDHWAEGYTPDAARGKRLFSERGCMACHSHDDFPVIKADFGPNLTNAHQKISSIEWLYSWLREPTRHSARTRMPNLYLEPETVNDVTADPAADIAAFLLSNRDDQGKLLADAEGKPVRDEVGPGRFKSIAWDKKGMDELARLYLSKVMTTAKVNEALTSGKYPEKEADAINALKEDAIKPDEVELTKGPITDETMLRYIGRRSVSRYGCYGCHDIPGFEKARPIGTGLQDWGRKDPTKLALEHIEEYLHHHGEVDGSSTAKRAENALKDGLNENFDSPEQRDREGAVAYFFDQLNSHGRAGFLWQKLRDPRSYDYKKIETKGYDERLRMPKFPFSETDIEAIATFVLGLVAEPPAEKYVYRPQGPAKARIDGEKLLAKYNCTGCHMVELPEITGVPEDLTPYELGPSDFQEAIDLLVKLRQPRDARTNLKLPNGDAAIRFHAMLVQPADPSDDPEDQSSFYDLWEPISLDSPIGPDGKDIPAEKRKLMLPPNRIEMKVKKLISATHGRGGAFAEWLVDASMKGNSGANVERGVAREMAPPTLYQEGIKAQTPWLYSFLKNPDRLRYTTVLRMPQFNMSNDEAEKLANYFSAVDGAPYPYQEVRERDPDYIAAKEHDHPGYLHDGWHVITMPPPTGFCAGCHSVGGREFAGGDPTKVTRGPNLDRVSSRLRPDWLRLWLYNPKLITPYTRMPQNFTRDKQVFPQLFGGNGEEQAGAASDALMNYLRLLEKEGKATAAAPADTAGADGGKQ